MKNNNALLKKCKYVKIVFSDVDGVLTDGGMYYDFNGESLKKFNTKDGMAVELLRNIGIETILITKENSQISKKRSQKIKSKIHLNVKNKKLLIQKILKQKKISSNEIAYIGDDVNDLDIIQLAGVSASPNDAINKIKTVVDYICVSSGGNGAFREFADLIINSKN